MRYQTSIIISLLFATATIVLLFVNAARAIEIPLPSGVPTQQLVAECTALKVQNPSWDNADCGLYFMVRGAQRYHYDRRLVELRDALSDATNVLREALKADVADFNSKLPLPTFEPTPTPTPTVAPTPTPTATPTASPTETP